MEPSEICDRLQALAQPSRIEILRLLVPFARLKPPAGLPAGEIARSLGLPPATLSFHLKELSHRRLVTAERRGRSIVYRAELDVLLAALDGLVTSICCE